MKTETIDSSTGILLPIFMYGPNLLFLAGKGDTTTRVYEVLDHSPWIEDRQHVIERVPQKGMAAVPTQALDHMACEVARLLRVSKDSVDGITFTVPKKSRIDFHEDIFPDTYKGEAACEGEEWFSGANPEPVLVKVQPSAFSTSPYRREAQALAEQQKKEEEERNREPEPEPEVKKEVSSATRKARSLVRHST
eukprot:GABW01000770.1.p1 GENE.GABW01000770.1~~GABW01000770.1.p1  ORF type:complete len:193 (-),score=80.42 GABW01000770.1:3-581(-)